MNILWIEDHHKHEEKLFQDTGLFTGTCHQYTLTQSFDESYKLIEAASCLFDLIVIDIDLSDFELGEFGRKLIDEFDDLDKGSFLREAGFHLYLKLLQQGFMNNRIVFLTANTNGETIERQITYFQRALNHAHDTEQEEKFANVMSLIKTLLRESEGHLERFHKAVEGDEGDLQTINACLSHIAREERKKSSQDNTYEEFRQYFHKARLPLAPSINKDNYQDFHLWLHERLNPYRKTYFDGHALKQYDCAYMTLRRGIIEACESMIEKVKHVREEDLEEFLLFYHTTEITISHGQRNYAIDYLAKLKVFFPLNPPPNKQYLYSLFLKELAADWEISSGYFISDIRFSSQMEYKFKRNCQAQMKLLRNWTAHNLISPDLQEQDVAYLFMLAMRSWFNLPLEQNSDVYAYERILATLFQSVQTLSDETIHQNLTDSYSQLIKMYETSSRNLIISNDQFRDLMRFFGELASKDPNMKLHVQKQSLSLFYQSFWHGVFPTRHSRIKTASTRGGLSVKIYIDFYDEQIYNYNFLVFLGKAIWRNSFS